MLHMLALRRLTMTWGLPEDEGAAQRRTGGKPSPARLALVQHTRLLLRPTVALWWTCTLPRAARPATVHLHGSSGTDEPLVLLLLVEAVGQWKLQVAEAASGRQPTQRLQPETETPVLSTCGGETRAAFSMLLLLLLLLLMARSLLLLPLNAPVTVAHLQPGLWPEMRTCRILARFFLGGACCAWTLLLLLPPPLLLHLVLLLFPLSSRVIVLKPHQMEAVPVVGVPQIGQL